MNKIELKDVVNEVREFSLKNFPATPELRALENIFEEMVFGEITIKIIDGKIESMQVTHNYKPIVDKENEMV